MSQTGADAKSRLIAGGGHRWTVTEATFPKSGSSGSFLMFNADCIVRKVRTYPADWYERSDSELYDLCLTT